MLLVMQMLLLAKTTAGKQLSNMYYFQEGIKAFAGDGTTNSSNILIKSGAAGHGAAGAAAIGGGAGDLQTLILAGQTAGVAAGYAAWNEYDNKDGRKAGALDAFGGAHSYADGDGQFGLALRTYLDGVGSGVDIGVC